MKVETVVVWPKLEDDVQAVIDRYNSVGYKIVGATESHVFMEREVHEPLIKNQAPRIETEPKHKKFWWQPKWLY